MTKTPSPTPGTHNDGAPVHHWREDVLEPRSGNSGHPADNIREQQGNHEGGMVPASYTGDGKPLHSEDDLSPEDAVERAEEWDSEA